MAYATHLFPSTSYLPEVLREVKRWRASYARVVTTPFTIVIRPTGDPPEVVVAGR